MTVRYWPRGRRARYISADVERALAAGELQPGDRLPAVRSLAARLAVSPATVATAYRELGRRGVVQAQGRRGTRITARPPVSRPLHRAPDLATAAEPRSQPDLGIERHGGSPIRRARRSESAAGRDLSVGNPDPHLLPDPSAALAAAGRRVGLYGQPPIDEAFAAWAMGDLAADAIPTEAVTVVSGALDGLERVLAAWSRPGDAIAVEDPGYPPLFDLLAVLGLHATPVGVDARGMTPEDLADALAGRATAVIMTTRAQNPTGAALDPQRADELRRVLDDHPDVGLIEDDHAGPIAGVPALTLSGARGRWAVVRSVAKSLGPDFRLAALAGDRLTVARVEGRQQLGLGWVSRYLQRAAALLAGDREVHAALRQAARTYNQRREALQRALAERGVEAHGLSGLNVWVPVPDEAGVVGQIAAGWTVAPGARFRLASEPGVRITTAALRIEDAEDVATVLAGAIDATRARAAARLG
jgi:DNA-binding transcriptional MocR family regulator